MAKSREICYPFEPKSTASLLPGQFWAIPLSNGSFACGRVLQLAPKTRVMFLAGLMDWYSDLRPNHESIAGANCIEQGAAHIKTILENGRSILGHRPLELDGIEPWIFRDAEGWKNSCVQYGFNPIRQQRSTDDGLPVFSTWGYSVISRLAENYFVPEVK
jgi:hypothetical protein